VKFDEDEQIIGPLCMPKIPLIDAGVLHMGPIKFKI